MIYITSYIKESVFVEDDKLKYPEGGNKGVEEGRRLEQR